MRPDLSQKQTQKLVFSPQMRQYLRLLQMPIMSLTQAVEAEVAENPVLEVDRRPEIDTLNPPPPDADKEAQENAELRLGEGLDRFAELDDNFQEAYQYPDGTGRDTRDLQSLKNYQESLITKPETLADFLRRQVCLLELTPSEEKIAEYIIGNIDEDGYLRTTVEDISQAVHAPPENVQKVLHTLQRLDPPGIAARNLQEALLLQLERQGVATDLVQRIVRDHLPLLERHNWEEIARLLNTSPEKVRQAAAVIARLEPKPGRMFYSDDSVAIIPDASVYFDEDEGQFKIEIHQEPLISLRISPYYRRLLKKEYLDEKTKAFLKEKMQAALNFLKSLAQRKATLRAITEEIVRAQSEFFVKGFAELKPLRLKDVAERLGIHESTVSRAINGKYMATAHGTVPYKIFFSAKLETTAGESASQKSVMTKIRQLVASEDPRAPLSDEKIVQIFRKEGIFIARRTVAKYRQMLKILPSHLRKKK